MNPYDTTAVRRVWDRVAPGREVFPAAPARGGKPPQGQCCASRRRRCARHAPPGRMAAE